MTQNVGGFERPLRIVIGALILCAAFFHAVTGTLAIVAYVVGALAFVSGVAGYCPAWTILGINTCHAKPPRTGASNA